MLPRPPNRLDAAEHHRRDGVEQQVGVDRRLGRSDAGDEQNRGDPGAEARDRVGGDPHAPRSDAERARVLLVAAGR